MIKMFLGAAAGYVLGTKAGRERYEQIRKMSSKAAENPTVKRAVGTVQSKLPPALQGKKPQHAAPAPVITTDPLEAPAPVVLGDDPLEGGRSIPLA
jgi:uncharacterized membrane protein YebE (DUF533 family)